MKMPGAGISGVTKGKGGVLTGVDGICVLVGDLDAELLHCIPVSPETSVLFAIQSRALYHTELVVVPPR